MDICGQLSLPEGDVWLDLPQQILSGQVSSDEDRIVNLPEPEELKDLLLSWSDCVDTFRPDHQEHFGFSRDKDAAAVLGSSVLLNDLSLRLDESFMMGLASFQPFSFAFLNVSSSGLSGFLQLIRPFLLSLEFLLVGLGNWSPRSNSLITRLAFPLFLRFINFSKSSSCMIPYSNFVISFKLIIALV